MAIDPEVLQLQRKAAQHPVASGGMSETRCICGNRTRDKSGQCRACRLYLPKVRTMKTEDLLRLRVTVDAELCRRREEIDRAISGAA